MTFENWLGVTLGAGAFGYILYSCARFLVSAQRGRHWPAVQGTIVDGSLGPYEVGGASGPRREWYAEMRYSFQAEESYFGNEFKIMGFLSEQDAQDYIRAHQGEAITVRYKPGNPDTSRANPTIPPRTFMP
jgi:Protein of unknown function (DUF3592)